MPNYFCLVDYICDGYLCLCPATGTEYLHTMNWFVIKMLHVHMVRKNKICFVLFVRFTGFRAVAVDWWYKACSCFSDPFQKGFIEVLYKIQHSESDQSLQN